MPITIGSQKKRLTALSSIVHNKLTRKTDLVASIMSLCLFRFGIVWWVCVASQSVAGII
jgi:hypothetical protein